MRSTWSGVLLALPALAALVTAGCSGARVEVSGKVTYNGAPLNRPGGHILFLGERGEQAEANIESNGTYRATGVATGLNRVVVYYPNPEVRSGKPLPKPGQPPSTVPAPAPFLTPTRYATAETSGLAVQVEPGTVYDAPLTGPEIP